MFAVSNKYATPPEPQSLSVSASFCAQQGSTHRHVHQVASTMGLECVWCPSLAACRIGVALMLHTSTCADVFHRCPHLGLPIQGKIVGKPLSDGCLECPFHGSKFDLATGEVKGEWAPSAPLPLEYHCACAWASDISCFLACWIMTNRDWLLSYLVCKELKQSIPFQASGVRAGFPNLPFVGQVKPATPLPTFACRVTNGAIEVDV